MNVEPLDVHISLLSRQLDAVGLDPEARQRSLQSGVLKLELSIAGVLEDGAPTAASERAPGH